MSLSCTDHLIQEHRLILRAVFVVEAMAAQARHFQLPDPTDVELLLDFLRRFADEHHQTKEESILFPALRAAGTHQPPGAVRQMIFEHEQERSLIQGLQDALRTRNHGNFVYFGYRMADLLSSHIYKEDNILFDLAEHAIDGDTDTVLIEKMCDFDRTLATGRYDSWVAMVNELERKYLKKVVA